VSSCSAKLICSVESSRSLSTTLVDAVRSVTAIRCCSPGANGNEYTKSPSASPSGVHR
jgi:hypothetical protein